MTDGGAAFPRACGQCGSDVAGMTLRDWFAGMALQGLLAHSCDQAPNQIGEKVGVVAQQSFEIADAMLQARQAA